jgi:hypothetical protein
VPHKCPKHSRRAHKEPQDLQPRELQSTTSLASCFTCMFAAYRKASVCKWPQRTREAHTISYSKHQLTNFQKELSKADVLSHFKYIISLQTHEKSKSTIYPSINSTPPHPTWQPFDQICDTDQGPNAILRTAPHHPGNGRRHARLMCFQITLLQKDTKQLLLLPKQSYIRFPNAWVHELGSISNLTRRGLGCQMVGQRGIYFLVNFHE